MFGQTWIDFIAPDSAADVESRFRIAARRQGPHDIVEIERIDIVIDNDDETTVIARRAAQRSVRGSHRVTRIRLFDRDDGHAPGIIDADDIGNPERFKLVPDENPARRENTAARAEKWRRAENDRIIAIEHALDHG